MVCNDVLKSKYEVGEISAHIAINYIKEHHEKQNCCSNIIASYGLFSKSNKAGLFGDEYELCGVIAFRRPWNNKVSSSILGKDYSNNILEIHRLCISDIDFDCCAFLIKEAVEQLHKKHPNIKGIVAYTTSSMISSSLALAKFSSCECGDVTKMVKLLYNNETEHKNLVRVCRIDSVIEDEQERLNETKDVTINELLNELGDVWRNNSDLTFGLLLFKLFGINNLICKTDKNILETIESFCK